MSQYAVVSEPYAIQIPLPEKPGYYIRWRLPGMGVKGEDWWMRSRFPSKDLEHAIYAIPKIRKWFTKSAAWDFAVVYWDGKNFELVYEDKESKWSEQKELEEYNAEGYN